MDTTTVLLKPDAIIDRVDRMIIEDIQSELNLSVIWKKFWHMTKSDAEAIYPLSVGKPIFQYMLRNLLCGPSLVLLVRGIDPLDRLNAIKGGNVPGSGLRVKYRLQSQAEVDARIADEDFVFRLKAANRIHVPDTQEEAAQICTLCASEQDREVFRNLCPTLYDLMIA